MSETYLVNPAFYDVLDDWIFPGMAAQNSRLSVYRMLKVTNYHFGSRPPVLSPSQLAYKRAILSRANWDRIQALREAYALRRQARYVANGGTSWLAKQYPSWTIPDMPKSTLLKYAADFVTSGLFREIIFTAVRVIDVVGFIMLIYAVANGIKNEYEHYVYMKDFLDRLKPLPYINNARTKLRIHYLPFNPEPQYPYNPTGRKVFTFQHVKQEVQDADLYKLGTALFENGTVYKYRPHLIMYYEIVCEVEFEVDLTPPS